MAMAFRLRVGDPGPMQQSSVTCGAACLTVARMLLDPVFAQWVRQGSPRLPGTPPGDDENKRFAAYEKVVIKRTNSVFGFGLPPNVPWPRALGTAPWGARLELENGASAAGTAYDITVVRHQRRRARADTYDTLRDVVDDGELALLYLGNRRLPRHVVLVLPARGGMSVDVYDPGNGTVRTLPRADFVSGRLGLSGWQVPWLVVHPSGHRKAAAPSRPLTRALRPRLRARATSGAMTRSAARHPEREPFSSSLPS